MELVGVSSFPRKYRTILQYKSSSYPIVPTTCYHLLSCQTFPYENGSLDALKELNILKTEFYVVTVRMSHGGPIFPDHDIRGMQAGVRKRGILRAKWTIAKVNAMVMKNVLERTSVDVPAMYFIRVSFHQRTT